MLSEDFGLGSDEATKQCCERTPHSSQCCLIKLFPPPLAEGMYGNCGLLALLNSRKVVLNMRPEPPPRFCFLQGFLLFLVICSHWRAFCASRSHQECFLHSLEMKTSNLLKQLQHANPLVKETFQVVQSYVKSKDAQVLGKR